MKKILLSTVAILLTIGSANAYQVLSEKYRQKCRDARDFRVRDAHDPILDAAARPTHPTLKLPLLHFLASFTAKTLGESVTHYRRTDSQQRSWAWVHDSLADWEHRLPLLAVGAFRAGRETWGCGGESRRGLPRSSQAVHGLSS